MLQCTIGSEGAPIRASQLGTSKRCRDRPNTVSTATERGKLLYISNPSQYTYHVVNGPERIGSLCPALTASLPLSQLADLRSVVSQVGQPQSCLLQSLQQRQEELRAHRDRVTELEKELK